MLNVTTIGKIPGVQWSSSGLYLGPCIELLATALTERQTFVEPTTDFSKSQCPALSEIVRATLTQSTQQDHSQCPPSNNAFFVGFESRPFLSIYHVDHECGGGWNHNSNSSASGTLIVPTSTRIPNQSDPREPILVFRSFRKHEGSYHPRELPATVLLPRR